MPTTPLRDAARLASLPHELLVELAATLADVSAETRVRFDDFLATRSPLPAWVYERVLLNEDLAPSILAWIDVSQPAAMQVCKTWKSAWLAGDGTRRGLRPASRAVPALTFQVEDEVDNMVALDDERLCLAVDQRMHIVNKKMETLQTIEFACDVLAVGSGCIFATNEYGTDVRSYKLTDFSLLVERQLPVDEDGGGGAFHEFAFAPGGPLFALVGNNAWGDIIRYPLCTIHALDPSTLETRYTIDVDNSGILGGLAVARDELYVGHEDCSLRVLSLSGEFVRKITGEWLRLHSIRFFNERLYLLELRGGFHNNNEAAGRRIFVLSPQGDTLQIYDCRPHLPSRFGSVGSMDIFDGELLISVREHTVPKTRDDRARMFALRGL